MPAPRLSLPVKLEDENGNSLLDPASLAIFTIPSEHHEVHEGNHYFYSDCITLASAATQDYLLTVPDSTNRKHILYRIEGSVKITLDLFEGADRTGTTLQTSYNNDRDSDNTATMTIHKGTSGGTTDGTNIHPDCSGSSTGIGNVGEINREREILLKTNTKYIFRITSGAANNSIAIHFDWYEHTPGEI